MFRIASIIVKPNVGRIKLNKIMMLGTRRGMSYMFLALAMSEMMNPSNSVRPNRNVSNDGKIKCTKNFHKQTGKRAKRRAKAKI